MNVLKTASLSGDGVYRYTLGRHWEEARPLVWVMLNPSTADATVDDPTIRRCIGFAQAWGYSGIHVVNLFALRSKDPSDLLRHPDPVGPENLEHVEAALAWAPFVIAAWGAFDKLHSPVEDMVRAHRGAMCLGHTKKGAPKHPLYIKADQPLTLLEDR